MALLRVEQQAEIAREILRKYLQPNQTTMRPEAALNRLEKDQRIGTRIEARQYLKALRTVGEITCEWAEQIGPSGLMTLNLKPASLSPAEEQWRRQVTEILARRDDLRPWDQATLDDLWPRLADWPALDAPALIAELYDLRSRLEAGQCAGTAYQISASGNLASSKLLSLLPKAALQAFGIDVILLPEPPPYLIVAGPPEPAAVVLVENPEAFETAVTATSDMPIAWVSTYGFGISRAEGAGTRMVSAVTAPVHPIPLIRAGAPPRIEALLSHPRLFHWGDLDRTGLLIFHRIRAAWPQLRLSALYAPMIALLRTGGGHPYADATGKPNQETWRTEDPTLEILLRLCGARAIDQEHLTAATLRQLALLPLEEVPDWQARWILS